MAKEDVVPEEEIDTWLSPAVVQLAKEVAQNGLKFTADKTQLKEICRRLAGPSLPNPKWDRIYTRVVDGLIECDRVAGWQTAKVRPSETDVARQSREEAVYSLVAAMYFKDRDNVNVGPLA